LATHAARWLAVGGLGAATVLAVLSSGWLSIPMIVIGRSLFAIAFAGIVILAATGWEWLETPWLTACGRYSYCAYMVHWFLHRVASTQLKLLYAGQIPVHVVCLYILVMILAAFAVSWLSWYLFERWFLDLKRFVPYSRGVAPSNRRRHTQLQLPDDQLGSLVVLPSGEEK
jgi:peptidoglycan/LPS O-acetylase OafA/YrhL